MDYARGDPQGLAYMMRKKNLHEMHSTHFAAAVVFIDSEASIL